MSADHKNGLVYGDNLLQGDLVYLDLVTDDDVPQFAKWGRSMELMRYLWIDAVVPQTEEEWKASVAGWRESRKNNRMYPFSIRATQDHALLGYLFYMQIHWRNRHALIGIAIGNSDYWGGGYGTEAMRLALRYGFMEMNLNRVQLEVFAYNTRAVRSYEKVGFKLEGTLRQWLLRDGEYHDVHIMGILRDEWLAGEKK